MPIYEYQCEACGHRLETMQKMSEDPLVDCPACGRPALQKLISAAGFQLKGSGWYATDFKHSGKKKPEEAAKAPSTNTEAAPDKKSANSEGASGDAAKKNKTPE